MVGTKILIVDDLHFCEVLRAHFEDEGAAVTVLQNRTEAVGLAKSIHPELVLLGGGARAERESTQLLTELHRTCAVPVVMMAATDDVGARLDWFEAGADDVLVKPFDLRELAARVKAVLRRVRAGQTRESGDVIRFDNFEISQERFELRLRGKKVEIPPKELQLLYCLASSPNRVFSREQLLEHVWDFAFLGDSRTVDVHIKRLREKLKDVSDKWELKTVWGVGYKFELYN
ncbi:MAG: response regulator transcription factor [Clostridia bacterium]|nr:response regulator transcription factor [Clostridia bacterium]